MTLPMAANRVARWLELDQQRARVPAAIPGIECAQLTLLLAMDSREISLLMTRVLQRAAGESS